jgi:altronate dehydratase
LTAESPRILGFRRADGRVGCRNHLLVLPSVVCATRVAQDIACAPGAVAVVHQHGCSQIGDDAAQTAAAFEGLACNPNVAATIVVGLGCETVQGSHLADRIARRGQRVEFVGIQSSGGSDAAVEAGRALSQGILGSLRRDRREPVELSSVVVGIEASRESELAVGLARVALEDGASVIFGDVTVVPGDLGALSLTVPAFGEAVPNTRASVILKGAGSGPQQHTALVTAGAHVVVSFPSDDQGPVGFPLCPVFSVAGWGRLHCSLADEFDADECDGAESLWRNVRRVFSDASSVVESLGHRTLALPRLARSM